MNKKMVLSALVTVALCVQEVLADAVWKGEVLEGAWTNASSWVDGIVPDALTPANVTNIGADYTVTVESDRTLYATNTTVGNANGRTTVQVNSPITFFKGITGNKVSAYYTQNAGATTVVGKGGVFRFDGPSVEYGDGSTKLEIFDSDFIVKDGGLLDFNTTEDIVVKGSSATQMARLIVTNGGRFDFYATGNASRGIKLQANSLLHVHDATLRIHQSRNLYHENYFKLEGGQVLVSGTGAFTNNYNNGQSALVLSSGSVTFRDDATYTHSVGAQSKQFFIMVPKAANQTITWTMDDRSRITKFAGFSFVGDSRGHAVFNYNTPASVSFASQLVVGNNAGFGEFNMTKGYASVERFSVGYGFVHGNDYYRWAGTPVDTPADFCPTGVVRVAGGGILVTTSAANAGYGTTRLLGLIIGDAGNSTAAEGYAGRPCYGRLELSDGGVTNATGHFVIGFGRAVGRFVQTGGSVFMGDWAYPGYNTGHSSVIGLAGGDGSYVLSNGVYTAYKRIFVGGASLVDLDTPLTNELSASEARYPKSLRNAKGVLTLACHDKSKPCSFTVNPTVSNSTRIYGVKGIWVGRDGDGTVELIGSGSTINTCGLTLTNGFTVANGETETPGELLTHGQATLRFVSDETGFGQINTAREPFCIAPNAKLEVDMSAYKGKRGTVFKLVDCNVRTGDFAPENIKLTNCRLALKDGDPDIYVKAGGELGLVLIVR